MRRPILTALMVTTFLSGEVLAGRHKQGKVELKRERVQLRRERIASGVTLTRAKTLMYTARGFANITGLFNPMSWILGIR